MLVRDLSNSIRYAIKGLSGSSGSIVMLSTDAVPLSKPGESFQLGSDAPLYLFAAARPNGARFSLEPDVPRGGKAEAEADVLLAWWRGTKGNR
jgi:hypothetical protein